MGDQKREVIEEIQRMAVRLLATTAPGVGLALIGGFRYRFLDQGPRVSRDIDYHWDGDLEAKQTELLAAFERRLLPEVRRRFGYSGIAVPHAGPEGDSPFVRVVMLAFWHEGEASSRIEIPVDITRIERTDDLVVKTIGGVSYPTASDQDMIENKIIAVFTRNFLQHRDMVDIFLFANHLAASSPERIAVKLTDIQIDPNRVGKRMDDLAAGRSYHQRAIDELIDAQIEDIPAANLSRGGGGEMVFGRVIEILREQVANFTGGG
ncbi:MAG: nucleotidyl transferase AbiEii/AbiGii toxin family protein [bacterium]|nr:nucleotidyl transferase AbiEii/AbiGii toxin family protein [bacterium]